MTYSVQTRVLMVDPATPDSHVIHEAAAVLQAGGLVAFPTETVYGLGANALDSEAIDRIYRAKQRPAGDPVIAHIHHIAQLEALAVHIPNTAYTLARTFWPGPLTLILRRHPSVPVNIATGRDTVAVRMPAHPVAVALLQTANIPIAAPSANTFTRPSATTAAHVLEDLEGRVNIVLDAGPTTIGLESTVLDLTGKRPIVLRPGGLALDDLRRILPDVIFAPRYITEGEHDTAPGQMLKHYSPRARVILFEGETQAVLRAMQQAAESHYRDKKHVGMLIADEDATYFSPDDTLTLYTLGPQYDLACIGHNLFAGLRNLDTAGVDVILTRDFGQHGLGAALWDRLLRAAEGTIVIVKPADDNRPTDQSAVSSSESDKRSSSSSSSPKRSSSSSSSPKNSS